MSQPHEPAPEHGADRPADGADQSGGHPAAEPAAAAEPAPSAASAASPSESPPAGPPPAGPPVGHYVPFDATRARRFGPAFGRFARGRATQLAAAMVAGALIGGGTVAIVDNAYAHSADNHQSVRPGGPFGDGNGRRQWFDGGNQGGPGGQGFGG